jgi:hypothetical protein
MTAKNNAVFNNNDDFYNNGAVLSYNASDDLDGTNAIDLSPEGDETIGWNRAFRDYANGDFRIRSTISPLYDAGTPIYIQVGNAGTSTPLLTDIKGNVRPQSTAYDIGAFEYIYEDGSQIKFKGDFKMKGDIKFK